MTTPPAPGTLPADVRAGGDTTAARDTGDTAGGAVRDTTGGAAGDTTGGAAGAAREPALPRLRPDVAVTPLRAGLHLRGRRGSVTFEGSTALPALWRLLEEPLRTGDAAELDRRAATGNTGRRVAARLRLRDTLVRAASRSSQPSA
ncbi:hypothetical protein AB0L04_32880, partial [Streptomyces glaucescens]